MKQLISWGVYIIAVGALFWYILRDITYAEKVQAALDEANRD